MCNIRGLNEYQYFFFLGGGVLSLIVLVEHTPKPYSNY